MRLTIARQRAVGTRERRLAPRRTGGVQRQRSLARASCARGVVPCRPVPCTRPSVGHNMTRTTRGRADLRAGLGLRPQAPCGAAGPGARAGRSGGSTALDCDRRRARCGEAPHQRVRGGREGALSRAARATALHRGGCERNGWRRVALHERVGRVGSLVASHGAAAPETGPDARRWACGGRSLRPVWLRRVGRRPKRWTPAIRSALSTLPSKPGAAWRATLGG